MRGLKFVMILLPLLLSAGIQACMAMYRPFPFFLSFFFFWRHNPFLDLKPYFKNSKMDFRKFPKINILFKITIDFFSYFNFLMHKEDIEIPQCRSLGLS